MAANLQSGHKKSIANDQREITPKLSEAELWFLCMITPKSSEAELWFLCMTHRLNVLYNCMKFHLNGFNSCQLTERT